MSDHRFAFERDGVAYEIRARHTALTDRMRVFVNEQEVPVQLRRKPFSSLFRYQFDCEGVPLEVRVEPDSMRSFSFELKEVTAPVHAPQLGPVRILLGCGGLGMSLAIAARLMGLLPWGPGVLIGGTATIITALLLVIVQRRGRTSDP